MLLLALKECKPSVSRAQYQTYLDMKKKFDAEQGQNLNLNDLTDDGPVASGVAPSAGGAAARPVFNDEQDDEDLDNIYG